MNRIVYFDANEGNAPYKNKIAPILFWFSVLSGILTAFFGIIAVRLPKRSAEDL